jgi:hypothetical protein
LGKENERRMEEFREFGMKRQNEGRRSTKLFSSMPLFKCMLKASDPCQTSTIYIIIIITKVIITKQRK